MRPILCALLVATMPVESSIAGAPEERAAKVSLVADGGRR